MPKTITDPETVELLRAATRSCGLDPLDDGTLRAIVTACNGELRAVFSAAGLRARSLHATVEEALTQARPDLPVVGLGAHAVLLCDHTDTEVEVSFIGERRWISHAELYNLLGDGEPRWWLLEPLFAGPVEPSATPLSPLRRLRRLLRAERSEISVILIYAVATGVLALATPLAIQVLISWLAFGGLLQPVVLLSVMLFVILSVAASLRALQRYAVEIVQRRVFIRLLHDVSERLTRVKTSAFDHALGPELVNRFFDVLTVQKAAAALLVDGASAALQACVGLILLGLYHPVLLVFDFVVIGAMVGVLVPLGRGATRTAIKESKRKYEAAAWVEELARHPTTIKLGGAQLAQLRTDEVARAYLRDRRAHFRIYFSQYIGMLAVQVGISSALLLLCGWLVLRGQLTVGQLVAAEFIVASALVGFSKLTSKLDTWYDLLAAVDKLGALADLPQERRSGRRPLPSGKPASVDLINVSLAPIHAFSAHLEPGELAWWTVAPDQRRLLAELIAGLREPSSGAVLRDGLNLRSVQPDAGFQEVGLARGTEPLIASIRDNIALARDGLDDAQVWAVLGRVGLADHVAGLTTGLDTGLGPQGRPLCPDQVARLLIARVLIDRPRLIIVDGLLDGCTPQTRDLLLNALKGTTVVVLSVLATPSSEVNDERS